MSDNVTLTGLIATTPRHIVTSEGLAITSFRLASQQRRFDKDSNSWSDGETNWYTVTAFRELAINASQSLHKGDRILTMGRLKVKDWSTDEKSGTSVEVEAESLGHDLQWGVTDYLRIGRTTVEEKSDEEEEEVL
jgi:single-strand DNA-binding protein